MWNVKLTYFKFDHQSGKYYAEGEFDSNKDHLFEIWEQVREMLNEKRLPGLVENHSAFYVLAEVPGHPFEHPHLLVPGAY